MQHFATALTEIIDRSFSGNRSQLAKAAKVSPSTIARFCSGDVEPSLERLQDICHQLGRADRKQLLMAAARDRVPPQFQEEIFGDEDPASQLLRAKLSPDLAAVIRYLESTAMTDDLTASYLRRIGDWIGLTTPAKFPMVAEDAVSYKAKSSRSSNA